MVVHTLAMGSTNKEIASELSITVATVKAHIKHIMGKTKCSTRTGILTRSSGRKPFVLRSAWRFIRPEVDATSLLDHNGA